jgi:hypothetical protein
LARHRDCEANADRRDELGVFQTTVTAKAAARDRYRKALENGAMDEAHADPRSRRLR